MNKSDDIICMEMGDDLECFNENKHNRTHEVYEASETEYLNTLNDAINSLCSKLQNNKEKIRVLQEILLYADDENPKTKLFGSSILQHEQTNLDFNFGYQKNNPKVYHPPAKKHLVFGSGNQKKFIWSDETDYLLQKYHKYGDNYDIIAQKLDTTVQECAQRMAKFRTSKKGIRWTTEMDDLLKHLVLKHGENQFQWISRIFNKDPLIQNIKSKYNISSHWNHNQLSYRWFNSINPNIKRGQWSVEEDIRLVLTAKAFSANTGYHGQWSNIQKLIPQRTQVQIRERLSRLRKNGVDVPYNRKTRSAFTGVVKAIKIEDLENKLESKKKTNSAKKVLKKQTKQCVRDHNRKKATQKTKKRKNVKLCRKNAKRELKIIKKEKIRQIFCL